MVLMALDHVRLFMYPSFGVDLSDSVISLAYYTVCAPAFVVLAGISAWLYQRNRSVSTTQLIGYRVTRGAWLILLELTVVNLSWKLGWRGYWNLQVLWAIGRGDDLPSAPGTMQSADDRLDRCGAPGGLQCAGSSP
jgi:uncharacterized membrane protein